MSFTDQFERLKRIHHFISIKGTGNPIEFASKLGLSRSGLLKILSEMKELGFPIIFDKNKNSYCYSVTGEMPANLFYIRDLNEDEMKKITGGLGYLLNNLESTNSRLEQNNFDYETNFLNQSFSCFLNYKNMPNMKEIGKKLSMEEMKSLIGGLQNFQCWGTCLDGSSSFGQTNNAGTWVPECSHHGGPSSQQSLCVLVPPSGS